jgi:SAM-dependent methyltransferase
MPQAAAVTEPLCHRRPDCRLCGSRDLSLVLKLTPTPPANAFVPEAERPNPQPVFPLDVFFCNGCGHVQILDIVSPELLFGHYVYVSGTSPVFVKHFETYARDVMNAYALPEGALAVDIGSNDGTLLRFFKEGGMKVLGIDPAAEIAKAATEAGIPTLHAFFDAALAREIAATHGKAAVVTANNVFAHIDDLAGVVEGVKTLLADDGVFVFEVSYLQDVFTKTLFDTIYHEHLSYHSVAPLVQFFDHLGMDLCDAQRVESHGGSLRGVACFKGKRPISPNVAARIAEEQALGLDKAETFTRFAHDIAAVGDELKALLATYAKNGKRIMAYGAPAKATTLMYHFGIGPEVVEAIVDDSPLKIGLYSPGMHIPVISSAQMMANRPDVLVVLAWNFADSIIAKNTAFREAGGVFVVPLPKVRIV